MKLFKQIFLIVLRIAASVLLLVGAYLVFDHWIMTGAEAVKATFLYAPGAEYAMDYRAAADELTRRGVQTQVFPSEDWEGHAQNALAQGATILVVGLDSQPQGKALLSAADSANATVFFVGTHPGTDYLSSYDKAYYVGSRPAYAGELAGKDVALAFRSGVIADQNANLLLDYLTTADENPMIEYALSECDHYGIYMQDCIPSIDDQTEAQQEISDADGSTNAQEVLAKRWEGVQAAPEVIFSTSFTDLTAAQQHAASAGWSGVFHASFATHEAQAQQMLQMGCKTVVCHDGAAVAQTVCKLAINLIQQDSITEGLEYAPDGNGAIWLPYRLYASATPAEQAE